MGIRCDACSERLYTEYEGQNFPEHITIAARNAEWYHFKKGNKWLDYCPECRAEYFRIKRERYFLKAGEEYEKRKVL